MVIYLTNQWVILERDDEPKSVLEDIRDYYSYNDYVRSWEKVNKCGFDYNNEDHLKSLAPDVESVFFQNYLCYHITGKYINMYQYTDDSRTKLGLKFKAWQMSDGYSSVFRLYFAGRRLKFRSGLLRGVLMLLQSVDIVTEYGEILYDIKDQRRNFIRLTKDPVYSVGDYKLREDQKPVIDKVRHTFTDRKQMGQYFNSVLLDLAVNFGKTILAACFVLNVVHAKVLMPFRDAILCAKAVAEYLGMGFDVGVVAANKAMIRAELKSQGITKQPKWDTFTDFTICMVQTVEARIRSSKIIVEDLFRFNLCMYDECETFTGKQSLDFIGKTSPGLQIGYSGTPLKSDKGKNRYTVLGLFGSQRYEVTTADNVEKGVSLEPHVHVLLNDIRGVRSNNVGYVKDRYIYRSMDRLDIVVEKLRDLKLLDKQIIFYFGAARIGYGRWLFEKILDFGLIFDRVGYIDGKTKNRSAILDRFRSGDIRVLVANRVIKKGLNIPNIEVWINWESTGNEISLVQGSIGRGTRKNKDAYKFDILAFFDQGHKILEEGSKRLIDELSKEEHGTVMNYLYEHIEGIPEGCG